LRYVTGAINTIKLEQIEKELDLDNFKFDSILFSKAKDLELKEQEKIKNPMDCQEDANYPCPRCKGIKSFRQRAQLRSGDEGTSLLLWCQNKTCGFHWRING